MPNNIKIIIYGYGRELNKLKSRVVDENVSNIVFKGNIDKQYIPWVLSKADLLIINYLSVKGNRVWKYGQSNNKLFEYLAAAKPILSTFTVGYSIIDKYKAGITVDNYSVQEIKKYIMDFYNQKDSDRYIRYSSQASLAATDFDFKNHAEKLESILMKVKNNYES